MIQAAESIRIRYNIPMDVHWSILSKFDEGVTQYMKHLQRFGVYTVRLFLSSLLTARTKRSPRCTARRTSPSVRTPFFFLSSRPRHSDAGRLAADLRSDLQKRRTDA